jgi:hypothetical protein
MGKVKRLTDRPIGATWALHKLRFEIDHFRNRVMEMKDEISMSMDQHRFPYLHTCEDILSQWSDYDNENLMR